MSIVVQKITKGSEGRRTLMVKDTLDVEGYRTQAGSRSLEASLPATKNAWVIDQLQMKGWQITAKTNLHELAFGTTGINAWTGTPINPTFPDRVPGGSSSGSAAAVAASLCDASLGTDTGGSVRVPAACCGVYGFKPTFGRVCRDGVMPAETTLDCVGPFARDILTLTQVLCDMLPDPKVIHELPSISLGFITQSQDAEAKVLEAVQRIINKSQFPVKEIHLPLMSAAYDAGMAIINRESWLASKALVETGKVGFDVAERLRHASNTSDAMLEEAEVIRDQFTRSVDQALKLCTVLVMPTMPAPAPRLADAANTQALLGMTRFVRPFNVSGHPAISLPLLTADGLPVGLQMIGPKGEDELLCKVAQAFVEKTNNDTSNEGGL